MLKKKLVPILLINSVLSITTWANETNHQPTAQTEHRVTIARGQLISLETLSSIADMSSARDQQGKPATLTEKTYTVGSFTRTTITVVPPNGGGEDDVITLDLTNH